LLERRHLRCTSLKITLRILAIKLGAAAQHGCLPKVLHHGALTLLPFKLGIIQGALAGEIMFFIKDLKIRAALALSLSRALGRIDIGALLIIAHQILPSVRLLGCLHHIS